MWKKFKEFARNKLMFQSLFAVVLLSFSTLVFSSNVKDPEKCPDLSVLKKYPFIFATKLQDLWLVFQPLSKYETNEIWEFALTSTGDNRLAAIKNAYSVITTLENPLGPVSVLGVWFCNYDSVDGKNAGQARMLVFK